jgi:hypothetical protein
MKASTRRALGSLFLLLYLPAYVALAVTLGGFVNTGPKWAQLLFYAIAGFIWVVPLKPLFAWMRDPAAKPPA